AAAGAPAGFGDGGAGEDLDRFGVDRAADGALNTVVLSEVVPGCAPPGLSLVSTSVLGTAAEERTVRARLAELYGRDTSGWEPLAAYRIPGALPAMPAPHPLTRTSRWAPGRYVCGDHRATGSVQGALASGARAAREVLADLAAGPGRP
ncbi:FAD-dependent oxidoreductase, partial [Kitasatospora sp. NPDC004272]